ncbi:MAG: hypothetical protein C4520_15450, partial [Candidatus Abyssobacteria bacterium SURF_5]
DPAVNPGAPEVCDDGIDNDCDGFVDAADPDCEGPPPVDADGDGYAADADCDDTNPAVNPGAPEVCDDGIDNDCDGFVDAADSDCTIAQPSEIHLLEPADGAVIRELPTFEWSAETADTFRLEFSLDPDFTAFLWHSPILKTTSFTLPSTIWAKAPQDTPIYWRVRGADGDVRPIVVEESEEVWLLTVVNDNVHDDEDENDDERDDDDDDKCERSPRQFWRIWRKK